MSSEFGKDSQIRLVSQREERYRSVLPVFCGIFIGYLMVGITGLAVILTYKYNVYFGFPQI